MGRLRRVQIELLALRPIPRDVVVLLLLTPVLLTLPVAVQGHFGVGVLLGPIFGGASGAMIGRAMGMRSLDRPARRDVVRVALTGTPSGSSTIDSAAAERLQRAGQSPISVTRTALLLIGLAMIALPIIAAMRDSSWWLLGWLSLPLVVLTTPAEVVMSDPRVRLEHLRQACPS